MHAVLDEDAAAEPLVPEPVVVGEVLVAGVVLEQEPLRGAEQALLQPGQAGQQRVVAEHVVDHERGVACGGLVHQLRQVLGGGGERLLAEHVPPGPEGPEGDAGVVGGRGRHHDQVDGRVGDQALPVVVHGAAVLLGQQLRGLAAQVGDRPDLDVGQVGHGAGEERREPAGAHEAEPERLGAGAHPFTPELRLGGDELPLEDDEQRDGRRGQDDGTREDRAEGVGRPGRRCC